MKRFQILACAALLAVTFSGLAMAENEAWYYPDGMLFIPHVNLLDNQEVINVVARYEGSPGQRRPEFGTGTRWQSPRYAQLVLSWSF